MSFDLRTQVVRILVDRKSCLHTESFNNVAIAKQRLRLVRIEATLHSQKSKLRVRIMNEVSEIGKEHVVLRAVIQEESQVVDFETLAGQLLICDELRLPLSIVRANIELA